MARDLYSDLDFESSEEIALDDLGPELAACLAYWRGLEPSGAMPAWRAFDLAVLPGNVLPLVTVVDVDWSRERIDAEALVYRFWGTGHVQAKGIERTGTRVSEHSNRAPVVEAEYLKVIKQKRPIAFRKNILIEEPRRAVLQTSVRLPLSNGDERVDNVLSASAWTRIEIPS